MNDAPSMRPIHARIAGLLAVADAERRAWLDRVIREAGRCRYCGANVPDSRIERSPGVCSLCRRSPARRARGGR